MEADWNVIVIGAGAAGLMAGLRAAERGRRVLVLEKNPRPGVKILMSGGTRCNITQATDARGIITAFGSNGKFLHSALAAFSIEQTVAFFENEGVATKVEPTGKIFPVSNKASDVLDALLRRLHRSGATLALGEPVIGITNKGEHFEVATPARNVNAASVILTSGGQSYPASGTSGDGYRFAAALGHTIVPPRPALAPLTVSAAWVPELRGITVPDVELSLHQRDSRKAMTRRRGSLLFAHFGLSGPVALDVSRFVSGHAQPETLTAVVDLLPTQTETDVDTFLQRAALESGKKMLVAIVPETIPRRLADTILTLAGFSSDRKAAGLTRDERRRLAGLIKRLPIPLTGTLGFKKAEVTAGGVALDEVDSRTLQSKLVPGLFLAGEILDLDGPIGGYNFQAAWSTGWLAGSSV